MMRFTNDFEKREWFGRQALKELQKKYPDTLKYPLTFSEETYSEYDCRYFVIDEETQSIKRRVWIEIKIRDNNYDEYILEEKKLRSLIRKRDNLLLNKDEVQFLYVNFTPDATLIWKIDDDMLNNSECLVANKATSTSRTNKVNKKVIYLNETTAKRFNYILNEVSLMDNYETEYLLPKLKEQIKKKPGLEDILFG